MTSTPWRSEADLTTIGTRLDLEFMMTRKLGLCLSGLYAGDGGLEIIEARPGVRWYSGRNTALQLHGTWIELADDEAIGGPMNTRGVGAGAGILARW
jgi:hypothetical protein